MWPGASAQRLCAATGCSSQLSSNKVKQFAGECNARRLERGSSSSSSSVAPARCHLQGRHEVLAVSQCHHTADVPHQAFPASSGLNSTLLHAQQQHVEQLLLQQPAQSQQQQIFGSPLQPHGSSTVGCDHAGDNLHEHSSIEAQPALLPGLVQQVSQTAINAQSRCEGFSEGAFEQLTHLHHHQQQQVHMLHNMHGLQQHQHQPQLQPSEPPALQGQQMQHTQSSQSSLHPDVQQKQQQQQLPVFSHPAQITGWIKHSSTVQELQRLHEQHGARFNPIHLSAMLVKLARLSPRSPAAAAGKVHNSRGHRIGSSSTNDVDVQQLAVHLAELLVGLLPQCSSARQAANAAWALAVLQCPVPHSLLQTAAHQLMASGGRLLAASEAQEVASLAWALAKLQYNPDCPIWVHLAAAAQQHRSHLKPQETAMLLWACAKVGQQQQLSRPAVVPQQVSRQEQAVPGHSTGVVSDTQHQERRASHATASTSSPATSNTDAHTARPQHSSSSSSSTNTGSTRSYSMGSSSSGRSPAGKQATPLQQQLQQLLPLLCEALTQQLQQGHAAFKAQELSMLLWSFATLSYRDPATLQLLADRLQQQVVRGCASGQDISSSLWALSKMQYAHPGLLCAAAGATGVWLSRCSNQEVGLVLLGSAAASWQLQGGVSEPRQAVTEIWQQGVAEVQVRLAAGSHAVGAAELATWLQAAAFALRPPTQQRTWRQQQQQQRSLRQQGQHQFGLAISQISTSGGADQSRHQQLAHNSSTSSFSNASSVLSTSSMSGSWDEGDCGAASVKAAAYSLIAAVQDVLISTGTASSSGSSSQWGRQHWVLEGKYVAGMLHSLAAAGPSAPKQLLQLLLAAAQASAPSMTRQQLCMTAWAAAKTSGGVADEQLVLLMETLAVACVQQLPAMQPQQLSLLAWSHARMWNLGDGLMMHDLARAALRQLPRFGPQALSNLTWAFARARHYDGALTAALARRAKSLLGQFSPAELSNLAWGLIMLRCRQSGLLAALAAHAAAHCSCWSAKACVKLATAYSSLAQPQRYRGLFQALGDALLSKPGCLNRLTPHELVQLAAAFASVRLRHKALLGHIAAAAQQRVQHMALVDQVQLVCALAALQQRHEGLLAAVSKQVAAELGKAGQQARAAGGSSCSNGSSDSDNDAVGDGSADAAVLGTSIPAAAAAAAAGLGSPSSTTSSSTSSSKLKVQHLARLAWAYKVLRHEDAAWYLAWHTAAVQQVKEQHQPWEDCSSSSNSRGSSSHSSSSSSSSSSLSRHGSNGRNSSPAQQSALLSSSSSSQQQLARHSSRSGYPDQQQPQACTVQVGVLPVLLQRPVHQQGYSSGNSNHLASS